MTAAMQAGAIRLAAVRALGQIGGQAAIDALTELYHDANLAVRWRSREALTCLLDCRTLPQRRPRPDYQGDSLVRILQ
jgi:HEAT repeat protein